MGLSDKSQITVGFREREPGLAPRPWTWPNHDYSRWYNSLPWVWTSALWLSQILRAGGILRDWLRGLRRLMTEVRIREWEPRQEGGLLRVCRWRRERTSSCSWFWSLHRALMLAWLPGTRTTPFLWLCWLCFSLALTTDPSSSTSQWVPFPFTRPLKTVWREQVVGPKPWLRRSMRRKKWLSSPLWGSFSRTGLPSNFEFHGCRAYE